MINLNHNLFGVKAESQIPSSFYVAQGATVETSVRCSILQNINAQLPTGPVVTVQAGLKCSLDIFYFHFPVLLHVIFEELADDTLNKHQL